MKIVVIVRTRDEERNVLRFCGAYSWADKILVADGGSVDNTKNLAKAFSNVEVRDYPVRVDMENGLWRNPHAPHINFLIDWATDEGADWIIFDDCDSVPNSKLDRYLFYKVGSDKETIFVSRLYLWGDDKYFPEMSLHDGKWSHALWAWRADKNIRYNEDKSLTQEFVEAPSPQELTALALEPPSFFLSHYSWTDTREVNKKLSFYRDSGQHPDMKHPLEFAGKLEPLPEWFREMR